MGAHGFALDNGWYLYTRGGLEGVFLVYRDPVTKREGKEVPIPKDLLLRLAAEEVRAHLIRQMEQATPLQILGIEE